MAVKKTKVKEWFNIISPKYFGDIELGKTSASEPEKLIGRTVVVSAINLTNNFSKYYLKFTFRVVKIDGNHALTEFDGSECLRDYVSRMIVRRVRRIDTVQDFTTKDNAKIRVKGLTVIGRRVKSSIQKNVRVKVSEMLKEMVENLTLEEFIEKILSDEIKNKILQEARKIYPIRNFEIRKSEILK